MFPCFKLPVFVAFSSLLEIFRYFVYLYAVVLCVITELFTRYYNFFYGSTTLLTKASSLMRFRDNTQIYHTR
jgi:hypothetical protein